MFGYINVNRKELNAEDEKTYQAYYCGLCRQLKNEAGIKGQMLLNYDMTFLLILLTGLYELEHEEISYRCAVHPAAKKTAYINAATEYAAAMDIVLSYHSLQDDYEDEGSHIKQAMAKALLKDYKRISIRYPRQVQAVEEYMKKLAVAEKAKESNIDIVAGYTGEMLGQIFQWKQDEWSKDLESMGFYMGKFIYLLDAYEDVEEDKKKQNYNPLAIYSKKADFEEFAGHLLTMMIAEASRAFEQLPILKNAEILRNILYSGVWCRYEMIKEKRRQKAGEKADE